MKSSLGKIVLRYFRFLAHLQLKKYTPDIIGITGSAGKTTAQKAIAAVLSEKYQIKTSDKFNSESGIPLSILGLHPQNYSALDWLRLALLAPWQLLTYWHAHDKYIVEMGIDSDKSPKNMDYLLSIIQPRIGIFLNALTVHSAGFNTSNDIKKTIAHEKGKLITSLPANGLAVLNADDPNVISFKTKTKAQVMTLGKDAASDVQILSVKQLNNRTSFTFIADRKPLTVNLPYFLADHYAYPLAAAVCVGLDEAFSITNIKDVLEQKFHPEPGRMSLFIGINDSIIIDSSYNAAPESTIELIKAMKAIKCSRKIAMLGDMRELGSLTQSEHQRVMDTAMQNVDELILVGPLMHKYALPYLTRKKFQPIAWFGTASKAAQYLKGSLKEHDCVLIKGSQNSIFMEIAVAALLKNEYDVVRLCRRGIYWDKQRSKYV